MGHSLSSQWGVHHSPLDPPEILLYTSYMQDNNRRLFFMTRSTLKPRMTENRAEHARLGIKG